MSNGEGGCGKALERNYHSKKNSINEEFVQAIAKMAVAQVCESSGFQGFQQSALNTLSDIAVRYISHIGKTANWNANLSGRAECNVLDIIQGLEDLGMSQGFSGAAETNCCLAGSGVIWDIVEYVDLTEGIPFAYSIPWFPVIKQRNKTPSFIQTGETPPGEHIPMRFLAFPDPETSTCLPAGSDRGGDRGLDTVNQIKEYSKVEGLILNMHQRLACNGSEMPILVDQGNASSLKRAAYSNTFLVAPLRFGKKELSPVILPVKLFDENVVHNQADGANHVTVLETFAAAIDVIKSRLCNSEECRKNVLQNSRPAVEFKFQTGKKSLGAAISVQNVGVAKSTSCVGSDNVKDDKKKESRENPEIVYGESTGSNSIVK